MRDGEAIAAALGGERNGKGWMFRCPAHDDKRPSASIRDDGLVTCWAGCDRRAVWAALDALGFTDDGKVIELDKEALERQRQASIWGAQQIWEKRGKTCPGKYLRHERAITIPPPSSLTGYFSGLMACLTSPDGVVTAVHTKWGGRKQTDGWMGEGAVRLGEPTTVLGLAEGVETALSAIQIFGVPTWATLGAQRLDKVWVPSAVTEVHLFPDNDDAGRAAAQRTVERHTGSGRRVKVFWPPDDVNDWNDVLRKKNSDE